MSNDHRLFSGRMFVVEAEVVVSRKEQYGSYDDVCFGNIVQLNPQ